MKQSATSTLRLHERVAFEQRSACPGVAHPLPDRWYFLTGWCREDVIGANAAGQITDREMYDRLSFLCLINE